MQRDEVEARARERRSPGSRRRVMAMLHEARARPERESERERRRDRSDLPRTCSAGRRATHKRIGRFDCPRPLTWPANLGRKPHHFVSGKVISDSEHISLQPHDMTRIAHTEIGARIIPQKPPGRALATGRGSRMPARASDQRRSTRPLRARQRGPHCTTFPGSIATSLTVETRRRSPPVGNPLLPVRAEGTLLWRNPCMFCAVRADPPWPTWSVLALARFC